MTNKLYQIFFLAFLVRVLSIFFISSFPNYFSNIALNDAIGFSMKAEILANNFNLENIIQTIKWNIYPFFLALIYYLITPNIYVGSFLTIFFWSLSFLFLYRILKLLNLSKSSINFGMLIFSFYPSLIIISSLTLRDTFILFFINLIIYLIILFYFNKYFVYLFLIALSLIAMSFLHEVFTHLSLILFFLFYIIIFGSLNFYENNKKIGFIFFLVAGSCIYNIDYFFNLDYVYKSIQNFQNAALSNSGHATYQIEIFKINNFFDFLYYALSSFAQYMFAPFVFELDKIRIIDIMVISENLFRIIIILLFFIYINISKSHIYFKILFLIIFLSIEMSWSMGTFNWGTAIRHHICSLGILSIFTAFLFEIKNNEK